MTTSEKKRFLVDVAFIAVFVILLFLALKYVAPIAVPFIIGFIVAIVLQKPVAWLAQKTRVARGIWSTLLVILMLAVIVLLLIWVLVKVYNEFYSFAASLTDQLPLLTETVKNLGNSYNALLDRLPDSIQESVKEVPANMLSSVIGSFGGFIGNVATSAVANIPSFIVGFVVAVISGIFMTTDYNRITGFILRQLSEKGRTVVIRAKNICVQSVIKMLGCYLLLMLITFIELCIGFKLIGIPNVVALALLISIVDLLPVLGTGTVLIPWGIIDLVMGNTARGFGILAVFAVVTVVRNVIEPKLVGKNVGLPPIVTLMAMYIGMEAMGLFGLVLFPVAIIVAVQLQEAGVVKLWK